MTFKVMSFNMQKDRNHEVQFRELLHFMDQGQKQWVDLMVLNEAYYIHPEVQHAATVSGYGAFHPNMVRGQNWNAVLWSLDWWKCIETDAVRLTDHGYQNTPARWASKTLLESTRGVERGERVLLYSVHYPPSWQWGIKTKTLVRDRVALAKQMDVAIAQEVRKARQQHPRAHVMVAGDYNCSSLATSNRYYPASFYPRSLDLRPVWTPARAKACHIRRPIDDVYHSRNLSVKHVELAGFEQSDHEPPIVSFDITRHLRRK